MPKQFSSLPTGCSSVRSIPAKREFFLTTVDKCCSYEIIWLMGFLFNSTGPFFFFKYQYKKPCFQLLLKKIKLNRAENVHNNNTNCWAKCMRYRPSHQAAAQHMCESLLSCKWKVKQRDANVHEYKKISFFSRRFC